MAEVFISYAREDQGFARDIHTALQKVSRDTWIDWRSIRDSAKWRAEIFAAIEAADNFLFIISPDSVKSWMCGQEVSHAVANNKRLITILHRSALVLFSGKWNPTARYAHTLRSGLLCRLNITGNGSLRGSRDGSPSFRVPLVRQKPTQPMWREFNLTVSGLLKLCSARLTNNFSGFAAQRQNILSTNPKLTLRLANAFTCWKRLNLSADLRFSDCAEICRFQAR